MNNEQLRQTVYCLVRELIPEGQRLGRIDRQLAEELRAKLLLLGCEYNLSPGHDTDYDFEWGISMPSDLGDTILSKDPKTNPQYSIYLPQPWWDTF